MKEIIRLSQSKIGKRVLVFTRNVEDAVVHAALVARDKLQPVRMSYSRTLIHGLATDRNQPKRDCLQTFTLVRFDAVPGTQYVDQAAIPQ